MQDGIQRRRRSSVFNLNEMTDPGGIALSRKKSIKIDPMSPGLMQPRLSMTARPSMTGSSLLDANPALLGLDTRSDSRRRSSAVKLNTAAETNRKNSAFSFGPSNLPQIRSCRFGENEENQDSTAGIGATRNLTKFSVFKIRLRDYYMKIPQRNAATTQHIF